MQQSRQFASPAQTPSAHRDSDGDLLLSVAEIADGLAKLTSLPGKCRVLSGPCIQRKEIAFHCAAEHDVAGCRKHSRPGSGLHLVPPLDVTCFRRHRQNHSITRILRVVLAPPPPKLMPGLYTASVLK